MAEREYLSIGAFNPAPYNPSRPLKPGDAGFEALRKSIATFGCVQGLVGNKRTGNLVGGHQTLSVLRALGRKKHVFYVVDLPLEQEQALNVRLNRRATDNDPRKLGELLQELIEAEVDATLTGMDEAEINAAIAELDAIAERESKQADGESSGGNRESKQADGEASGGGGEIPTAYQVLIDCQDEAQQQQAFELINKAGYTCRVLTL